MLAGYADAGAVEFVSELAGAFGAERCRKTKPINVYLPVVKAGRYPASLIKKIGSYHSAESWGGGTITAAPRRF